MYRTPGPKAAFVEYWDMKFVIAAMPDPTNIRHYIEDLEQYCTNRMIKTSAEEYDPKLLNECGIIVEALCYPDGTFPSYTIIDKWLIIVQQHLQVHPDCALGVHDHQGLGRAPTLVAIALMEAGLTPINSINAVRQQCRGAFNQAQYEGLLNYKSKNSLLHPTIFPKDVLLEKYSDFELLHIPEDDDEI